MRKERNNNYWLNVGKIVQNLIKKKGNIEGNQNGIWEPGSRGKGTIKSGLLGNHVLRTSGCVLKLL